MTEVFKIIINKATLDEIHSLGLPYKLDRVDVIDFNYSKDTAWSKLSKEAKTAYAELKKREYYLRFNTKAK